MLSGLPEGPGKLRFKTQAPTELLLELGRSRSAEWRFWEQLLYWPALGVRAWGRFAWLPPPHAPSAWPLPHAPSAWPPPLAPLPRVPSAWLPSPMPASGALPSPWLSLDTGPVWSVSLAHVVGGYIGGDPGPMGVRGGRVGPALSSVWAPGASILQLLEKGCWHVCVLGFLWNQRELVKGSATS